MVGCALLSASTASALSLEAHEIGSGFEVIEHWRDDYGGFDRDYHSGKHIKVIVRDVSRKAPEVDIDAYFFGRRLPNKQLFIYAHQHHTEKLDGLIEKSGEIYAPDLKGNLVNLPLINDGYGSGALMEGWVIVGTHATREFDVRASSQGLLDLANNRGEFSALITDYEKRTGKTKTFSTRSPKPRQPTQPQLIATPPPTTPRSPVAPQYVTLRQPVEVKIPYGSAVLPVGTRLEVLDQRSDVVKVRYANSEQVIPISATNLAPPR